MFRLRISLLVLSLFLLIACDREPSGEVILVVFAHPDDETTIGPVLHRYGQHNDVYLLFATDGRFGATAHSGIPAGDSLVRIREAEATCSCEALGIHPPIFLGLQDGLGLNGHGNFYEQEALLKDRLLREINRIDPTIIVTFGPGGDTGHPDHRMVGAFTTELLLRENLTDRTALYYFSWIRPQAEKFPGWNLNYADKRVMDVRISYSETDEAAAMASIRCHKSQYTEEEMERWIELELGDPDNQLYFRSFQRKKKVSTHF